MNQSIQLFQILTQAGFKTTDVALFKKQLEKYDFRDWIVKQNLPKSVQLKLVVHFNQYYKDKFVAYPERPQIIDPVLTKHCLTCGQLVDKLYKSKMCRSCNANWKYNNDKEHRARHLAIVKKYRMKEVTRADILNNYTDLTDDVERRAYWTKHYAKKGSSCQDEELEIIE